MNEDAQRAWKNEALNVVLEALAASESVSRNLIFKGGRVLHRRLPVPSRQSYDIDAVLTDSFIQEHPERDVQRHQLEHDLEVALTQYFETKDPVRYLLESVTVTPNPRREHIRGWNAFDARIRLSDMANVAIRGVPTLDLDLVAPELLGENAFGPMTVDGHVVMACTLQRIAGEKLRAFLTSLPTYRMKVRKPGEVVRVKDIYDIACIAGVHPTTDITFWHEAAYEFRLACESRFVDCVGMESFEEDLNTTISSYATDQTIPKDIPFALAWQAITDVVALLDGYGIFPLVYPTSEL